jgi:hypothetical protein
MTDARLRALERRWRESGSLEDEVAYLLERLRTGDLLRDRVELAAYCGHAAARHALGAEAPPAPPRPEQVLTGITQKRWGAAAKAQAFEIAAEIAAASFAEAGELTPPHRTPTPLATLRFAASWLGLEPRVLVEQTLRRLSHWALGGAEWPAPDQHD